MTKLLSQTAANQFLTILLTIGLPFAVSWLKSKNLHWSGLMKFFVTVLLAIGVGSLKAYADGAITDSGSILTNVSGVLSAALIIYEVWFKALGFEQYMYPKETVIDAAQQTVKESVSALPDKTIDAILDPKSDTTLTVDTEVVNPPQSETDKKESEKL